jgi:acyl-coenzyme A synthetase/AMP-(fatty) acid ligase
LHFDLSILDIYVAVKHAARLVLIGEELGKDPRSLAPVIASEGITVWYSTPSILSLLANFGRLERHDFQALRLVLFAGEVFPIPQFRRLAERWPHPRFFNLYGPTETNVCTFYEVPEIPDEGAAPFPIGSVCPPNRCRVVDEHGRDVSPGTEGELVVSGPNVMQGYWSLPERNARAFLESEPEVRWYRTGDVVIETDGLYVFQGRRDRMVKRRGYRVELGEIEAGLTRNPDLREVAVVAVPDGEAVKIQAFVTAAGESHPSIIDLKRHASAHLPQYMVPDTFHVLEGLPRTSTDKIDYQRLLEASRHVTRASVS